MSVKSSIAEETTVNTDAATHGENETTATNPETVVNETNKQMIYVGPNIANERLNRFAVFRNGLPQHMDDTFSACPAIEKLFVPVEKLSETLEKMNQTGSAYHTWYAQVSAYLASKRKGAK